MVQFETDEILSDKSTIVDENFIRFFSCEYSACTMLHVMIGRLMKKVVDYNINIKLFYFSHVLAIIIFFVNVHVSDIYRWNAPVSIALHAPGTDFTPTVNAIRYLRDCTPESALVRQFTTFHIYFSSKHIPKSVSTSVSHFDWNNRQNN